MLTISKPLSAGQAQIYHQKEFTAKEQNYWSQRGVIAGEWQGRLAGQFGLAGTVSAEDFAKLSQGQHPQTGEQLVRQRASYEYQDADGKTITTMEHRAGWDATFSAPKSVSLTALVGGDERVREAHRESVRVALDQLEHYTQARIGGNHPPETTGKFIAAKFEHDTARPVDGYVAPQLHTHAVVFNVTERDNGQPRAIQPRNFEFGQAPADEHELVKAFLKTDRFVVTSPNAHNQLGLGTTQLYNKRVVYNQKRHGTFPLGNRMVTFERRMNVPRQLSPEFMLVDLVNELGDLAEDRDAVLSRVREKAKEMDPKKLSRAVSLYGKYSTQKKFQEMLQHA